MTMGRGGGIRGGLFLGIVCAAAVHAGVILFGGSLFSSGRPDHGTLQKVELVSEVEAAKEKEKPREPAAEKTEEMKTENDIPPDAAEVVRDLEPSAAARAPELDAASLGAIEAALNGQGGGGDFGDAVSFASGGRIGGTGKAGTMNEKIEESFSLAEIDQKPQPVFQTSPVYPAELRSKKLEGVVSVIFIVDAQGRVMNQRAEKSSHPAFEKPALEAVRQWKFEPAVKAGQRVACNMRVSIRFQPR